MAEKEAGKLATLFLIVLFMFSKKNKIKKKREIP